MTLKRFLGDTTGATVIVFALTIPVVIGAAAFAVDISYYRLVQNTLQSAADSAAVAATGLMEDRAAALALALDIAGKNVPGNYGTVVTDADVVFGTFKPATMEFDPVAEGGNAVKVTASREPARGNAVSRYLSKIWGDDEAITVRVQAIAARTATDSLTYEPPEKTDLDPEAGDYNQMYVYCYDYNGPGSPASRRSQMTLIADNRLTQYDFEWPQCAVGESMSFRMRNVRHARTDLNIWNNPQTTYPEFSFFTDTEIEAGVETFHIHREIAWTPNQTAWKTYIKNASASQTFGILETVRCDNYAQCDPDEPGHIIPSGKDRTPQLAQQGCEPGKFMYFGWEDRPPNQPGNNGTWTDPAWTDKDFDDIRIVMKCPAAGLLGADDLRVRLVM